MVTVQEETVLHGSPYRADCPTRHLLDRIGDRWTVLVVGALWDDSARFSELRRRIEGISQKMLTQTLRGLERDGLVHQIRVAYRIELSGGHVLLPRASFQVQDRDGEAMAHDLAGLELDYLFAGDKTTVTAALYAESARYHEENPIYGRPADARGIGTSVIVLSPSWLPGKWSTGFRGAAWRDDSDIKFFDARFASLALVSARRW